MMRFINRNQVELFSAITVSSGDALKAYLYDRDRGTRWISTGSTDGTTETITIEWAAAKLIDKIVVCGHNLKQFTAQYWNGAAYVDFSTPINETTNAAINNLFTFTQVSTLKIQLTATKTHVVDAQKYIGELIAGAEYFNTIDKCGYDSENPQIVYKQTEHEKSNGGSLLVIEATSGKYRNAYGYASLPKSYVDLIMALKALHQSFWFIPDTTDLSKMYFCNMIDAQFKPIFGWSTYAEGTVTLGEQLYEGSLEVKET